jgi:TPR repeat protein
MKTLVFAILALVLGIPSYAQYSARSLTRKVVPPQQQPTQPVRPAPGYAAPAQPAAPRELTPEQAKRAALQQNKNDIKQFEFYKRRAEEGSDDAQFQLATRYLTGKGTEKNSKLARQWLEKAAAQGHSEAKKLLASLGPVPAEAKTASATAPAKSADKK